MNQNKLKINENLERFFKKELIKIEDKGQIDKMHKQMYKIVLIFLGIHLMKCTLNPQNSYSLNQQIYQNPCSQLNQQSIYRGINVFNELKEDLTTITITGWIFLAGFQNVDYTIISIYERETNRVLLLTYNMISKDFKFYIETGSANIVIDNTFQLKQWYFVEVFVQKFVENDTTNKLEGKFVIFKPDNVLVQLDNPVIISSNVIKFDKSNMRFSIGWPDGDLHPCCCYTKGFTLYWNDIISSNEIFGLFGDPSVGVHNQMFKLDFLQHKNNQGYFYNQIGYQDKYPFSHTYYDPSILHSNQVLTLGRMNFFDSNGFTLSFYFKIHDYLSSDYNLLTVSGYQQTMILQISFNYEILFKAGSLYNLEKITSIQSSQWVQVILIVKQTHYTSGYLIINTYNRQAFSFTDFQYQSIILDFGDQQSIDRIQLMNINIYQGTQMIKTDNCFYQINLLKGNQCLTCKDGFLIDQQNDNQCVPFQLNASEIPGLKDFDFPNLQCPEEMIVDRKLNTCVCRKQYYKKDGKCLQCPKFCNECIDEITCDQQTNPMRVNGKCPIDTFDDGYNCIKIGFIIPNKINKVISHPILDYDELCIQNASSIPYTFDDTFLELNSNDSFFFSFSLKYKVSPDIESIIGYIENQGQIILLIKYKQISLLNYIQFLYKDNVIYQLNLNLEEEFWVGIWTDFQDLNILVLINGYNYIMQQKFDQKYAYSQPKICVGPCKISSFPNLNYFCGQFTSTPILYIKNIILPKLLPLYDQLFYLPFQQTSIISYFIYTPSDPQSQTSSKNLINNQYELILQQGFHMHQNIKGFALYKQQKAKINFTYSTPLSFSCSIFIDKIQKNALFIEIDYLVAPLNQKLSIKFVPHESRQSSQIQICFGLNCLATQRCMVDYQKPTFLMVKYNQKCIYCDSIKKDEFEVVINYCREKILFLNDYITPSPTSEIRFGNGNSSFDELLIFFNYLKLYSSNGYFYFSYSPSDPCFIYINLSNMKCLYPKEGYLLLGETVISIEDCLKLSIEKDILYAINEFSKECLNTQLSSNICIEYDLLENKCLKCRDNFQDTSSYCTSCISGYYFNQETRSCQLCHFKCVTCAEQYDNCTSCKYKYSQKTPSCECQSFQFLTNELECQNCSPKCSSCQDNSDNCINCAQKRIDPPTCNCDTQYYQPNYQNCDDLICDNKCQSCKNGSSQCDRCKIGRANPPECFCDTNHYPIQSGECISCRSDQYFDLIKQQCIQCSKPCKKCFESSNKCLECEDKFQLFENKCLCSDTSVILTEEGQMICPLPMELELSVKFINNQYQLDFKFPHNLKQIDFDSIDTSQIMSVYLSQIPQENYSLKDFQINNNILSVAIFVKNNFQTMNGNVVINQTELLISQSEQFVLNYNYKHKAILFSIGPLFLEQSQLESKGLDETLSTIKNANEDVIQIIQQFQIIFYFLNTLQPTVMILLFKAQLPPNLYKLCQLYGIFSFPFVSDYSTQEIKQEFALFGKQISSFDIKPSSLEQLQRLGFSNSLLINIPIIIIKQLVLLFLLSIPIGDRLFRQLMKLNSQQNQKLQKLKVFTINKIIDENETNLLLISLSILAQFSEFQDEQWAYRYGVYASMFQILFLFIQIKYIYQILNHKDMGKYNAIESFTLRLNFNNLILSDYYFLIQLAKKYTIIMIKFFFYYYPSLVGVCVSIIYMLSGVLTFYQQPYKKKRTFIFKILGEIIMSIIYIILTMIKSLENKIYRQDMIDEDYIKNYFKLGSTVIILLLIFNILYFIEFLAPLLEKLVDFIRKRMKKEDSSLVQKINEESENENNQSSLSLNQNE